MRRFAAIGLVVTIALGLLSRRLVLGVALWDKSFGDVAYAVMIGLLFLLARPRLALALRTLLLLTFGTCFAIECFQLTGLPARSPGLLRFVLGTTFAWHDVACYAVGAAAVTAIVALRGRRR